MPIDVDHLGDEEGRETWKVEGVYCSLECVRRKVRSRCLRGEANVYACKSSYYLPCLLRRCYPGHTWREIKKLTQTCFPKANPPDCTITANIEKLTFQEQVFTPSSINAKKLEKSAIFKKGKKASPPGAQQKHQKQPSSTPDTSKITIIEKALTHDLYQKTLNAINLHSMDIQHPWTKQKRQRSLF